MTNPVQFKMILPADVKSWLEAQAKQNIRSQGAEIIAALRERMDRENQSQA